MAEPHLARFRQTLKSAIQARQAETASARQIIYDAMEKALERSAATHPERHAAVDLASLRLSLKNAIVSVEDDCSDSSLSAGADWAVATEGGRITTVTEQKGQPAKRTERPRGPIRMFGLLGVIVAAVIGYSLFSRGLPSQAGAADFEVFGQIPLASRKGFTVVPNQQGDFVTLAATPDATVKEEVSIGAFLVLPTELEEKFSGRQVAIDINVRSSPKSGAEHFLAAYFTGGVGNSGWQEFRLDGEFSQTTFEFKVPERKGEPGKDYLGFIPGKLGHGGSVDIRSVKVRVLD